jgi:hypothetical protein
MLAASPLERVNVALLRPVDSAWLAAFRVLYGCALCASMLRFTLYDWVDRLFVAPRLRFTYYGFGWVERLPGPLMHALFWALAALALCIALGVCFRVVAFCFALGLSYVQLLDVSTYLNHYYLAALLAWLLAFSPAQRLASVDVLIARRRARKRGVEAASRTTVAAGFLYLFRFQVAVVYVFAGIAKAQSDWLVHAQPLRIWLGAKTHLPLLGPLFTIDWMPLLLSWAGFLFDSTIVAWLLMKRTRGVAYAVVVVFHVFTRLLFPIGMFPVIMVIAALVFFEPSWPRELWRKVGRRAVALPAAAAAGEPTAGLPRVHLAVFTLAACYCAVQLALPLRAYLYGGNLLWHEQGMRFGWRVMVRAKGGSTELLVRDTRSDSEVYVNPRAYLTAMQESEMSSQPDLILQLAHHVREDFERRGLGPVEVRAITHVSLNGRRAAPLIDPTIDLSRVRDSSAPAPWILPAPSEPPPHTRPVL